MSLANYRKLYKKARAAGKTHKGAIRWAKAENKKHGKKPAKAQKPKAAKKGAKRAAKKAAKKTPKLHMGKRVSLALKRLKQDFYDIAIHKGASPVLARGFVRHAMTVLRDHIKTLTGMIRSGRMAEAAKKHEAARVHAAKLAEDKIAASHMASAKAMGLV